MNRTKEFNKLQALLRKEAIDARIIARIDGVGEIEDVYGTRTSFNVLSFTEGRTGSKFYKSCYNVDTARKYLRKLEQIKIDKA